MRKTIMLWELYDITSSKRVFKKERTTSWVPFYRAREIVTLSKQWFVDNELFISRKMYEEYTQKYWKPKKNDILVTWVWTIGICYFVDENDEFYFKDGNIIWFKSKWENVDSRYVEYLFKSPIIKNQILHQSGSVVATLTIKKAKSLEIPLPPLSTQIAIVAKLDEISASIEQAKWAIEQQIEKVDELMKAELDKQLQRWEWQLLRIKQISESIQYWYTGKTVEKWNYRYLRITDIQNNEVNREAVPLVQLEEDVAKKYKLNKWDIVFARTGATVWKSYLIWEKWAGEVFASYLIRIVPNYDIMLPEYIQYFFYSNQYRDQIYADVVWAAQPNFNWKKLWDIRINIPSIEEQKTIVKVLDELRDSTWLLKQKYETQIYQYDKLRASILDKAFSWELVS
jgi:type I restriction enzyme S subunit